MVKTYILDTAFLRNEDIFVYFYKQLSLKGKTLVDSYKCLKDKILCLGKLVLEYIVLDQYKLSIFDVKRDNNNKPFIENCSYKFNISHKGRYVCLAISKFEVGIDIEVFKKVNIGIAKKLFTNKEVEYIKNSEDMNKSLITIWSVKESVTKCVGTPKDILFNSFEVDLSSNFVLINDKKIYYKIYYLSDYIIVTSSYINSFRNNLFLV